MVFKANFNDHQNFTKFRTPGPPLAHGNPQHSKMLVQCKKWFGRPDRSADVLSEPFYATFFSAGPAQMFCQKDVLPLSFFQDMLLFALSCPFLLLFANFCSFLLIFVSFCPLRSCSLVFAHFWWLLQFFALLALLGTIWTILGTTWALLGQYLGNTWAILGRYLGNNLASLE